ncbi:hypothetical protein CspeluHIS016_0112970 [Cutaneotrichosporon spelunceum]|uniref:Uncharacterized protein n=1 Tax=Cutaneotrichosporon spelunceum TaxID=1672016 RepID=A0AAD3Y9B4_9TREE|nr:hypothetical protein CspeluHIS016_0112970 [Cutaneotrichosporon spelunceum]
MRDEAQPLVPLLGPNPVNRTWTPPPRLSPVNLPFSLSLTSNPPFHCAVSEDVNRSPSPACAFPLAPETHTKESIGLASRPWRKSKLLTLSS